MNVLCVTRCCYYPVGTNDRTSESLWINQNSFCAMVQQAIRIKIVHLRVPSLIPILLLLDGNR